MTLHKEFWGLIFLGFVFWVIAATTPNGRIENACRPVAWTGNVITSLSALVLPKQQATVQGWFNSLEYGCQYTSWRLFYQDEYNKWKAAQGVTAPAATLQSLKDSGVVSPPLNPASAAAAQSKAPAASEPVKQGPTE
ncbi:hypothetical protein LC612_23240 [Nostoc sp. CHAB 5834]|nr:hypothetical protein [Nostoc sp. CHAB 5834]